MAVLAAALRLSAPLAEPTPAPAAFTVVFPTITEAAPAHPTQPSRGPVPASIASPPPGPVGHPAQAARRAPGQPVALASRPRAAAPRRAAASARQEAEAGLPVASPVSTAQVVDAPRSAPAPDPAAIAALEEKIDRAVNAAKSYPPAARRLGMQGRSQISFSYRDGIVTDVALTRSSAAELLDRAALDAVRRAAYPASPPELSHRPLQLAVWLDFSLNHADW